MTIVEPYDDYTGLDLQTIDVNPDGTFRFRTDVSECPSSVRVVVNPVDASGNPLPPITSGTVEVAITN